MKWKTEQQYVSLRDYSVLLTCLELSILISLETVIVQWQQHLDREANWPPAEAVHPSSSQQQLSRHLPLSLPQFTASDLESSLTPVHLREVPPRPSNTCQLGCSQDRELHAQARPSRHLPTPSLTEHTWRPPRCLRSEPKVYQRK